MPLSELTKVNEFVAKAFQNTNGFLESTWCLGMLQLAIFVVPSQKINRSAPTLIVDCNTFYRLGDKG